MSAEAEIKSFVERVLRLKEEQDALTADIREIYAEAKGRGFDKTALGQVVAHARKIDKKGRDVVDEQSTLFDMYLAAYEGSPSHAHAREDRKSVQSHEAAVASPSAENGSDEISASIHERPSNRDVSTDGKAWAPGASQGNPVPAQAKAEVEASDELPEPATHDGHSEGEAASVGLPTNQPETATKPGQHVESPVQRALADENLDVGEDTAKAETMAGAVSSNHSDPQEHVPSRAQAVTAETDTRSPSVSASNTVSRIRPYCQKPGSEECGGYGSHHCHACAVLIRSTQRESELVPAE